MKSHYNILITTVFCITCGLVACNDQDYEIDFQNGYPDKLAGNWIAADYQLTKDNYLTVIDTINDFDLSSTAGFQNFINLLEITAGSDKYDLTTALDPNSTGKVIINNLYNSGVRVRAGINDKFIEARLAEQLDLINHGIYGIAYVSVSGQILQHADSDVLYLIVGFYDDQMALFDAVIVEAFRKTGFEDTEYQSMLNKK